MFFIILKLCILLSSLYAWVGVGLCVKTHSIQEWGENILIDVLNTDLKGVTILKSSLRIQWKELDINYDDDIDIDENKYMELLHNLSKIEENMKFIIGYLE